MPPQKKSKRINNIINLKKSKMKKFFTLLLAVLVVNVAFSQLQQKEVRTDNKVGIMQQNKKAIASKDGTAFWFDLSDALFSAFPEGIETGQFLMLQDSVAVIHYTNGDGRPQFFSVAQTFDFADIETWVYSYEGLFNEETGEPIPVPVLASASNWSIDSVYCMGAYLRGDSVPTDVVDTLVITIAASNRPMSYWTVSSSNQNMFVMPQVRYNRNSYTIDTQYAYQEEGSDNELLAAYERYHTVKIPLTADMDCMVDEESFGWRYYTVPVEGFQNISSENLQVSVAYTFISASDRNLNSEYGVHTSSFRGFIMYDPREGFDQMGSDALMADYNTSICAIDYSISDPTFFLYEHYVSNGIWNGGYMRPSIGILTHSTNPGWVGVEEMAKNDMSVRPNPATESFVIDFAEATTANVQLFNLVGQEVYSTTANETSLTVNVNDFTPGVYMLRVAQNGNVYTTKVIVK